MKCTPAFMTLLLALSLLQLAGGVRAGERTLVLRNWVDRDWPRTLLNYDITLPQGQFFEAKVDLLGANSVVIPHQLCVTERYSDKSIKRCRLSFYSELKKDQQLTFTLVSSKKPIATPPQVILSKKGDAVELTTAVAGVRIPAPTNKTFKTPVTPDKVPAPILAYRLVDGSWAGNGWLESDSKYYRLLANPGCRRPALQRIRLRSTLCTHGILPRPHPP